MPFIMITQSILLISLMMLMFMIISKKNILDREKLSPFECGFDNKNNSRNPFSMRFFMILLLFLIFDIELVIMMSTPKTKLISLNYLWSMSMIMFMLILITGLMKEWNKGMLKWV